MRVLFLTNGNVHHFGVAEVFRGLVPELAALGATVLVYSAHETAREPGPSKGVFPIFHGPLPEPALFGTRRSVRHLIELCREQRIDLIHSHHLYRGGYAARLVSKATGIPYLITSHHDLSPGNSRRMNRWLPRVRCRAILRDARAVTHLNNVVAAPVLALLDVHAKSRIIPNGVNLSWWQVPAAAALAHPYLLGIGRLVQDKGFQVVIEAVGILKQHGVSISLVLAGEGKERSALERRAAASGLAVDTTLESLEKGPPGQVCFPGMVTGVTKKALFQGCRLLVFPSQTNAPEAMPVVLEAIAAGKAIVASDIPTAREVLAGQKYGALVPPADISAWVAALERLVTDNDLRKTQEQINRARSLELGWAPIAQQYFAVYQELLAA